MSDTTETPPADPDTPAIKTEETAPAQETDWKSEARKWEERAKANKAAADKLAEFEESQKTEAQKAADRAAELEAKVKEYETREQVAAWKAAASKRTGVPVAALAGSTQEEVDAHADTLQPLIAKTPGGPVVPDAGDTPPSKPADDTRSFLRGMFGDQ